MKQKHIGAALLFAALSAVTHAHAGEKTGPRPHPSSGHAQIQHLFVIVLENHSAAGVIGNANSPYITSLAHQYASASKYYGVTHPSLPNYVALISGSNWWVNDDKETNRFAHTNLIDQLEAAHKTWAGYMESLPRDNKLVDFWPDPDTKLYASKHNPFVLFEDIRNNEPRLANVKPYTDLATDLAKKETTPNFALVVPDQCNDMHGGVDTVVPGHPETPCPYGAANDDKWDANLKRNADAFVKAAVAQIMASQAWRDSKSVIVIVADEGDYTGQKAPNGGWDSPAGCCDSPIEPKGDPDINAVWPGGTYGGGLVPAIVMVSRDGKTGGYVSDTPYNHYSLLATIETIWNLELLGFASDVAQVKPMTEFLKK